jgi:tRNA-2-methylthio-N6-dimethylallyladenosine synthase
MAEYCDFHSAYVFKYSPRPGTPAFQMDDPVIESEKTRRFLELDKIIRHSQQKALKSYLNRTVDV